METIEKKENDLYADRRVFERHNRKLSIEYGEYNVYLSDDLGQCDFLKSHTMNISRGGMLFLAMQGYKEGTLLKIKIRIPDYWDRKAKYVKYGHVAKPCEMSVLCKVTRSESLHQKKKHKIAVKTVNIDQIDEQVLLTYLSVASR